MEEEAQGRLLYVTSILNYAPLAYRTKLVESVISTISDSHRDKFHVVRLNGFIHTDDKIASREIWRQLGHEMDVEDETTKVFPPILNYLYRY